MHFDIYIVKRFFEKYALFINNFENCDSPHGPQIILLSVFKVSAFYPSDRKVNQNCDY